LSESDPTARVAETSVAMDLPLRMHPLVYLADGDEVTIGRRDTDSYAILPEDGAELVRRLEAGLTPRAAAEWYEREYRETVDIGEMIAGLDELGFVCGADEEPTAPEGVRWARFGAALFSTPALVVGAALVAWAVVLMARDPDLAPAYDNVFYTDYFTVMQVGLFLAAIPLLLLHESFHALAGRRLGLRSTLRIDNRLYYIVLETAMDGLVTVPRRQRYLPIVAGALADVLAIAVLTIAADLTRHQDGTLSPGGRFALAVAFVTLLRIVWQFSFYLRTDFYVLVTTVLGCDDLHTTAKRTLRNRVNSALGRRHKIIDESDWHPVDRKVAAWYWWMIPLGYAISLVTFAVAVVPIAVRLYGGAVERFLGDSGATDLELLDSSVFLFFSMLPIAIICVLALRNRRRGRGERRLHHVIT